MLITRSNRLVSSLSRSTIRVNVQDLINTHRFSTRSRLRGLSINYEKIIPCHPGTWFRPMLEWDWVSIGRDKNISFEYGDVVRRVMATEDRWGEECLTRWGATRLPSLQNNSHGPRLSNGALMLDPSGSHLVFYFLREACKSAFKAKHPVKMEVEARKVCARVKDPTYPDIYHSLPLQADMLYMLGRIELERDPIWRPLAAYMLTIATGLGHLEAALLLHQLAKSYTRYTIKSDTIQVIQQAAEEHLDWRALVAHSEYLMWNSKGRGGRQVLQDTTTHECMYLLSKAVDMTNPTMTKKVKREAPPKDHIDAESLEAFDPPHALLLDLASKELLAGRTSDTTIAHFEKAARTGAYDYASASAAWQFAQRRSALRLPCTAEWVELTEFAARAGNPNACTQLAIYHLTRDGWLPTLSRKLNDEIDLADADARRRSASSAEARLRSTIPLGEESNEIMRRRNSSLLRAQDGLMWLKTAAQLESDSAHRMTRRCCMVAGLYRQNGFREEGARALEEGREALGNCVDSQRNLTYNLEVISQYLDAAERSPLDEMPGLEELEDWVEKEYWMGNIYKT